MKNRAEGLTGPAEGWGFHQRGVLLWLCAVQSTTSSVWRWDRPGTCPDSQRTPVAVGHVPMTTMNKHYCLSHFPRQTGNLGVSQCSLVRLLTAAMVFMLYSFCWMHIWSFWMFWASWFEGEMDPDRNVSRLVQFINSTGFNTQYCSVKLN